MAPGNRHYCSAGIFSWIWIVTYPKKSSQVWNCVQMPSLLEELKVVLYLYIGEDCVEKIVIAPEKKPGTATEHVSTFSFPLPSSGVETSDFCPGTDTFWVSSLDFL